MPRYRRAPLTLAEILTPGAPIRVRDLVAVTGLSDSTVHREIAMHCLQARKLRVGRSNSLYFIDRTEAKRWLIQIGILSIASSR